MAQRVEKQTRIAIWAAPRCLSNALARAMHNRKGTKIILEAFSNAYYLGAERLSERHKAEDVMENCRYEDVKQKLEQSYEGYSTIVTKELAYTLGHEKEHMSPYIPAGYVHTFIIRHPVRSISSMYKVCTTPELSGYDYYDPREAGFREVRNVYEIVTEELGLEAVVIDADDLLEQPEAFLRSYCEKIGIAYEDSMVHWSTETEDMKDYYHHFWPAGGWKATLLKTNTFETKWAHNKLPDVSGLPDIAKKAIEDAMPHYNALHEKRLIINKTSQ